MFVLDPFASEFCGGGKAQAQSEYAQPTFSGCELLERSSGPPRGGERGHPLGPSISCAHSLKGQLGGLVAGGRQHYLCTRKSLPRREPL